MKEDAEKAQNRKERERKKSKRSSPLILSNLMVDIVIRVIRVCTNQRINLEMREEEKQKI